MNEMVIALMLAALSFPVVATAQGDDTSSDNRDGLVLELKFEGDLADTSAKDRLTERRGDLIYGTGRTGKCLQLDGAGSYVVSGTNLLDLTDTFTVECWVKPAAKQSAYADILGNHDGGPFSGLVLQQEGEQSNCYYLAYGTGKAWVYTKTIPLAPAEWQHVAVVKTPERLRFYLNGMLVDSKAAAEPMVTSTTPLMVGNGIGSATRCFKGAIDELRVWSRRVTFQSLLTLAQQAALFAKTARLETTGCLFRPGDQHEIALALDPEIVPAGVDTVTVTFECQRAGGKATAFPKETTLTRAAEFRGSVAVPAEPGYFRVSYSLSAAGAATEANTATGTFTFAALRGFGKQGDLTVAEGAGSGDPRPAGPLRPTSVVSLDGDWLLATDPGNVGREEKWFAAPVPGAVSTRVPWIIQDAFPGYHGVAWYWREVMLPPNPHRDGRYLLRFWAADYLADVWVNGVHVGQHEGGETPFALDATDAVRQVGNLSHVRLAVRVLNPTNEPIDGIRLNETPRRAKVEHYSAGASYDHGGIVGSVELVVAPPVWVEDLYVWPDPATGIAHAQVTVRNTLDHPVEGWLELSLARAASGETLAVVGGRRTLPPGDTVVEGALKVDTPKLWSLNDPFLYRVTARVSSDRSDGSDGSVSVDERSVRCGFRDFRFENGYFRLNGRRLFIRSSHTVNAAPVGQQVPADPGLFRRDLLYVKAMGFNAIRFIWGGATPEQLDLCDEIGLLVYNESYASQSMDDTPQLAERFDRSVTELITRDRSHPSVVLWGLLNEASDNASFRHAVDMLPLVRYFDDTRVVMLNSGRYEHRLEIGSLSNPGASGWERVLSDQHNYPRVPHPADTIRMLRTLDGEPGPNEAALPVFLTEYGIGSAVDLWRTTRHFERLGKEDAEDAQFYRDKLNRFLADWDRWKLAECFGRPEDFFAASLRKMAGQRTLGLNALRANPNLVGYSLTGTMDHVNCGEGLFTLFRELKPGTVDALFEGLAPLRLCLFAEPVNAYRGATIHLEASLANEDALPPGEYPIRLQVLDPANREVLQRTTSVTIPAAAGPAERPFALPLFSEQAPIDGPAGKYRFVATMERGGAPTGGTTEFHLADPAEMPPVETEVTLWGDDPDLSQWLTAHGIRVRPFAPGEPTRREVILVSGRPAAPGNAAAWRELVTRVARGATVVFLSPDVFAKENQPVGWLPLTNKGTLTAIHGWLYLKDEWAKQHPIFDGLAAGGLMDYTFYRELIPDAVWSGLDPPAEAVAGAVKASQDYASGLLVSVNDLGAGRFLLNTLNIRQNLSTHPAGERLLRNMLRYAARDVEQPLAELPPDWDQQLKAMGY